MKRPPINPTLLVITREQARKFFNDHGCEGAMPDGTFSILVTVAAPEYVDPKPSPLSRRFTEFKPYDPPLFVGSIVATDVILSGGSRDKAPGTKPPGVSDVVTAGLRWGFHGTDREGASAFPDSVFGLLGFAVDIQVRPHVGKSKWAMKILRQASDRPAQNRMDRAEADAGGCRLPADHGNS